ncbi:MAG TPA: bifunctional 2-polyprenyl-6-hydroxyphenol methylase/3-demethylubiquinol 3-O-methyltransferase UbiG [Methylococcaceae bacterium]|jgi:2-polyprenyl-6-hydroxyphenyl methylase/3-demethylubiquinone-9 3-methyltransferase|nr:bifunctional 2-polyprenyl-6-hydroxyphenol methylase/3-demethylubiquinol 3-O-methyltransferase UbiG [Methylococcaceae bacterium]HIN68998.1 bifunctional 2-polyprenyl-6-hydroxyphenol methylase/3-demethylubiquinol 3-O-methyltransferase UbiG [Methylococcales bacterium]HIA44589.1 bifunctional 2-polyprenyl-6-hydroxyphenol methylase/3-demethylubiquinol 3-O-methyltransferase UbiG [Methylococcaceae bacterium]HIB62677.1 bifunctional 2-polyprenyl-6-hydroxyphenol methylase/3-demethylubiquinol 3-O-methyltr
MTEHRLNFDPQEIAKFEELASRWWDPDSEFKPLHEINPLRLEYIERRSSLKGKTVVDIGCGGGILAESMALKGANVLGIDMGKAPLSVAQLHKLESGAELDYQQITAEELADKEPGKYDVVTCMEMLEHVPDPSSVIAACSKLVKPDGHVFFTTINRNPKSYLFAIVGAEYIMKILPKGTHDYSKFIKPSELESWARAADLQLRELTGMSYNILSKKYSLGHDVDVNYLMHTQK